jgi:hypothetical protein
MMKKKIAVNYRKGKKNDVKCSRCISSIFKEIKGIGFGSLGFQWRCKELGLDAGMNYRIQPGNTCDRAEPKEAGDADQ